jgi:hypothetical protein
MAGWADPPVFAGILLSAWFILKIWKHPQTFEFRTYDWIWGTVFVALIAVVALATTRFASCWFALRTFLTALERHPLREALSRLPKDYSWSPIWQRSGMRRNYTLMARAVELSRALERDGALDHDDVDFLRKDWLAADSGVDAQLSPEWPALTQRVAKLSGLLAASLRDRWTRDGLSDSYQELRRHKPPEETTDNEKEELERMKSVILKEEFIALPFVAFIRYGLVQLRNLLSLIVTGFIFALASVKTYPFQSQTQFESSMTVAFVLMGGVVIWTFIQMDRDPTLSRLSNRESAGLGWDFVRRIAAFGTLPLLTLLAAHFPTVGDTLVSWLDPLLRALKE